MTETNISTIKKLIYTLHNAVTTNTTSDVVALGEGPRTVQASITGTGTVSATVSWYGSNINSNTSGILCATSSLSGTNSDITGISVTAEWPYMYAVISSITGTGAAVTTTIGE
jgi:hypothetical protein